MVGRTGCALAGAGCSSIACPMATEFSWCRMSTTPSWSSVRTSLAKQMYGVCDALRRVRSGLLPGAQGVQEDASERLQGEGVIARLARVRAGQRGERDDDPFGEVHEQRGHPRFGGHELGGGFGVAGLRRPEVVESAHHRVRGHRGERRSGGGFGHDGSSRTGCLADRGGLKIDPRGGGLWIDSAHRRRASVSWPRATLSLDRVCYVRHTDHSGRGEISVPAPCARPGKSRCPPGKAAARLRR
jgi:hypothetical protein